MTIGEVAKLAGLRPSAIRFYEKAGLLPKPARAAGQRRYDHAILERLAVLERAKTCGFTLEEIRILFDGHGRHSERWRRLARHKIAELKAAADHIARMQALLERRCQCPDLAACGRLILKSGCGPRKRTRLSSWRIS
jgi:MerR family transcriptional regulator, redox-sensitive transcriptional activator SoxR